jgi:hypothetical protein
MGDWAPWTFSWTWVFPSDFARSCHTRTRCVYLPTLHLSAVADIFTGNWNGWRRSGRSRAGLGFSRRRLWKTERASLVGTQSFIQFSSQVGGTRCFHGDGCAKLSFPKWLTASRHFWVERSRSEPTPGIDLPRHLVQVYLSSDWNANVPCRQSGLMCCKAG